MCNQLTREITDCWIVEVFKLCVCAFVVNMMDFCVSEQFRTIAERMRWGKICGKSEEGECKSHTE